MMGKHRGDSDWRTNPEYEARHATTAPSGCTPNTCGCLDCQKGFHGISENGTKQHCWEHSSNCHYEC